MDKVLLLTRREISAYFVSPIAYVAMALFLVIAGFFFALSDFRPGAPAAMRSIFDVMMVILVFVLPIITMRALSEEQKSGTIETLLTAPVTDVQVVAAKFLGSWLFFLAVLAPTLVFVVLLAAFSDPDYGPIASGYLGLALLGALYVAVGLLASSLTCNQVIAAVTAFVVLLMLAMVGPWLAAVAPPPWRGIIQNATIRKHYLDFSQGVVDLVHIVYFVALTAYALFLTVKVLESRRWR
ncbi:MAG: ABC transporter permease subunit [Planctomycetes bacterium]|nr:ABC transporter permease subunit [Planctomycetota bacterium]